MKLNLDCKIDETYPRTNPLFHYVCLREQIHVEQMNQNYVRTLKNLYLSFIKFYVLLNCSWFLYFFFTVVGLWNVDSSIIVYKIGLWWPSSMMYRKVASCLHQTRKQREEDRINFHKFLEAGRAPKEPALLFYEVLVCPICACFKILLMLIKTLVTIVKKKKWKVWWLFFSWKFYLHFLCRNLNYVFLFYYSSFSEDDILNFAKGWKIVLNNS